MHVHDVYIWWDEFDRKDMPCRCMRCGTKDADWVKRGFEKSIRKNGQNYRRIRKVEVPLCKEHNSGLYALQHLNSTDFDDNGVWCRYVEYDFVEALKKHRKAEVKSWKEENEDADPDDFEDSKLPPGLRTEPKLPPQPNNTIYLYIALAAFILVPLAMGAICLVMAIIFFLIGLRR